MTWYTLAILNNFQKKNGDSIERLSYSLEQSL